ncbi:MAG: MFS transporter [Acidimicrobiales bacterium]
MDQVPSSPLRLYKWTEAPILAVAWISFASGVGQFGVVSALGDVARTFGHLGSANTITAQAGLSGTSLGLGLACIRLAALGALPLAALADRIGRRKMLIATCSIGLVITVLAAASPGYWWFVVIFATGRPLLTATNSLCSVSAAEETSKKYRATAMALVAGGYGVGAGTTAVIHSLAASTLGFRGICLLAVAPLATLPFVARRLEEPERFTQLAGTTAPMAKAFERHGWAIGVPTTGTPARPERPPRQRAVFAALEPRYRRRLAIVALLAFFLSTVTGPANTFVYLYAQNVVHLAGIITAAMVVCAGATGLLGLLLGRWSADKFGRRPTGAIAMMAVALLAVVTYGGSKVGLFVGYVAAVGVASVLAPAAGALVNELFPTEVRASIAGWQAAASVIGAGVGLVVFGAVADIGNRFAFAATLTFLPAVLVALTFFLLPETKGHEPEDMWPVVIPNL